MPESFINVKKNQGKGEWDYNGGGELVRGSLFTCTVLT
jgi:hypothetical protein